MKLAIMQPYFFPYIGYFQLMNFVDKYVFYDDVNYIKNGWINRNQILIDGQTKYFTLQQKNASSFKKINEVELGQHNNKLIKTIEQSYKKSLFFNDIFPIIEQIMSFETDNLSEFVINNNIIIAKYLDINCEFIIASKKFNNQHLQSKERVLDICHLLNASTYINAIGGKALYDKSDFKKNHINLSFLQPKNIQYRQIKNDKFVSNLSIIDVLMNCGKEQTKFLLNEFELQ